MKEHWKHPLVLGLGLELGLVLASALGPVPAPAQRRACPPQRLSLGTPTCPCLSTPIPRLHPLRKTHLTMCTLPRCVNSATRPICCRLCAKTCRREAHRGASQRHAVHGRLLLKAWPAQ